MVFVFVLAHSLMAAHLNLEEFSQGRAFWTFLMILSFFLRMRIFDEIKDLDVDLKVNPTRPLARGLLSVREAKKTTLFLIVFELCVASSLGRSVFLVHGLAIGYSLLMFEEFFIGDWLRTKLSTYAVTHTLVSVWLGISCLLGQTPSLLDGGINATQLSFVLMNWCFFNLFEFARKTFAKSEERPGVESYSSLFSPLGAVVLSISQSVVGTFLLLLVFKTPFLSSYAWSGPLFFLLSAFYGVTALGFGFFPRPRMGKIYRGLSSLYLVLHYGVLAGVLLGLGT